MDTRIRTAKGRVLPGLFAAAGLALLVGAAGCDEKAADTGATAAHEATSVATAEPTATATAAVTAEPTAAPTAEATAAPAETAAAAAVTAAATAAVTAAPAASASAAAGASKYDCGSKGQKACPMQGWMKGVMGNAAASGDAEKLASALSTVAAKPVAGFGSWSSIASAGAAKAKAGDIDGAKESCKQCHDLYKKKYVDTMRDKPW